MTVEVARPPRAFEDPLPREPLRLVSSWLEEARASATLRNPDAMALATVDAAGAPHVRMVLCRGFDPERGTLRFYTNRESPKGAQLEASGRAEVAFYWDALGRQLRVGGPVERTSDADSDAYFARRHPQSQISAWASAQSQPLASREDLFAQHEAFSRRFGAPDGGEGSEPIPRPPHWGGYVLTAERIEFWIEGEARMHERAVFTREIAAGQGAAPWRSARLQP